MSLFYSLGCTCIEVFVLFSSVLCCVKDFPSQAFLVWPVSREKAYENEICLLVGALSQVKHTDLY